MQSFKDYEVILMKVGSMPITSNRVIESAKGDIVKILYMDDYFAYQDALKKIVDNFGDSRWMVTGCLHDNGDRLTSPHQPTYSQDIHTGNNTIGSPSVLAFKREGCLFFDENLSFLLDCDLYSRYYETYGSPMILNDLNVIIGLHEGQTSNLMPDKEKIEERNYMIKKHS